MRENAGGRSSMVFDYRIVGRPYGDTSVRLAAIVPNRFERAAVAGRGRAAAGAARLPKLPAFKYVPLVKER